MNLNPNAKRILCFGDSLTYGRVPNGNRYYPDKRFTGIAQQILGSDYEIIEEGLRGRTLYGENKFFPGREGNLQFGPIVGSHVPLDLIIVMLGTNDSNSKNNILTEDQVHDYLDNYLQQIDWRCKSIGSDMPKILLMSPPNIIEDCCGDMFYDSSQKIHIIQEAYRSYSRKYNLPLIETCDIVQVSVIDGVHLNEKSNKILGETLARKIKEII